MTMKVSIITICYNRSATIAKAIESVLNQDYPNIEYIVIDGNSTDGTQAVIAKYSSRIAQYISEPDQGMYDALNKGLQLATGDVVGLMHSDDEFYDTGVVSKIVAAFMNTPDTDGVYGDGVYISNDTAAKVVRNRIGGAFSLDKIKKGWLPLHPTVYLKKSLIDKYGAYNLDFKIASDTEFLLRYLFKYKIKMFYLQQYIVKMRMGGLSTSYARAFEVLKEDYAIYKFHNVNPIRAVFQKKLQALTQYLKK
ncbi:glycosyltransferase family 2 protein [Flavobacterium sp. WC2421]|uniref:glycosyltransferase family 2 protein n=1 Tax=Flavobacterium sp. WC2421 TaxID=3234138 RepID=UPI00346793D3